VKRARVLIERQFLQGEVDTVVPVEQMKNMVDVLQSKGVKSEIIVFEGEGHGWRKAATIKRVLEKELEFVGEIFGLQNDS
jgi:dipeptidyl aminopeptidase/acylaminoacyl peptidase